MQAPYCKPGVWPDAIPHARMAAHIQKALPTGCRAALLGLPDDTGVRLNHGRPGASAGPRAFRAALARYGVAEPEGWDWPRVFDAGDVEPAHGHTEASLHETHRRVTEAARALLDAGLFPIAIGGGHDLTFPFVRAVHEHLRDTARPGALAGLYFDAHLDVRDTPGSGMPFRRLIEACAVHPLLCAGFNPLANTREHVQWFHDHGGEVADDDWAEWVGTEHDDAPLLEPLGAAQHIFCSFDLDVLDASHAPGVSAVNPAGISVRQAARAVMLVASDPRLRCMDFMELCPAHDEPHDHANPGSGRTARAAAHLFLHALMGLTLGPLADGSTRGAKGRD
ncbi:MAG: formimidoylglutamase [Phycisphaerales bacterium]